MKIEIIKGTETPVTKFFSSSSTPETDELDRELHTPHVLQDRYSEMLEHARKLERELAEARELAAMWKANHDNQVALKAMLMDRPDLGDRASRISELIRERDEAREENAKLRDIVERAINYLDQSYRDGFADEASDLRYEIEQLKGETK